MIITLDYSAASIFISGLGHCAIDIVESELVQPYVDPRNYFGATLEGSITDPMSVFKDALPAKRRH